jgi:hypothetical protein
MMKVVYKHERVGSYKAIFQAILGYPRPAWIVAVAAREVELHRGVPEKK